MKISGLLEIGDFQLLTSSNYTDREITGCYIGDLLSWVMGRAKPGDAWITIMNNINIIAVATLTDCSCIILSEGVKLEDDIIKKADSEGIIVIKSEKTSYEISCKLHEEI